jgi:glycosyltransferase involved in cell wall biosynthesis
MAPRVSVIVPCFNDGPLAIEAVRSVREREPVELVVVDDGSSEPDTVEALDRLRGQGTRVITRENGGLSAARMTGVEETSAPYLYPLDSDDRMAPGAAAVMADALDRNERAAFAYGDYEVFGEYTGLWVSRREFSHWAQTWANFIPVGSMVRRKALLEVGGWELRTGVEDWDLWLKLAEAGWTGVKVPRVVYERRVEGARMHAEARTRHRQLVNRLRERHPKSFGQRRELAKREGVPLRWRVTYPVIFGIRNRNLLPYRIEEPLLRRMLERNLRKSGLASSGKVPRGADVEDGGR